PVPGTVPETVPETVSDSPRQGRRHIFGVHPRGRYPDLVVGSPGLRLLASDNAQAVRSEWSFCYVCRLRYLREASGLRLSVVALAPPDQPSLGPEHSDRAA